MRWRGGGHRLSRSRRGRRLLTFPTRHLAHKFWGSPKPADISLDRLFFAGCNLFVAICDCGRNHGSILELPEEYAETHKCRIKMIFSSLIYSSSASSFDPKAQTQQILFHRSRESSKTNIARGNLSPLFSQLSFPPPYPSSRTRYKHHPFSSSSVNLTKEQGRMRIQMFHHPIVKICSASVREFLQASGCRRHSASNGGARWFLALYFFFLKCGSGRGRATWSYKLDWGCRPEYFKELGRTVCIHSINANVLIDQPHYTQA
jgi:hypothetical protein